jgi:hypothetical protein
MKVNSFELIGAMNPNLLHNTAPIEPIGATKIQYWGYMLSKKKVDGISDNKEKIITISSNSSITGTIGRELG